MQRESWVKLKLDEKAEAALFKESLKKLKRAEQ